MFDWNPILRNDTRQLQKMSKSVSFFSPYRCYFWLFTLLCDLCRPYPSNTPSQNQACCGLTEIWGTQFISIAVSVILWAIWMWVLQNSWSLATQLYLYDATRSIIMQWLRHRSLNNVCEINRFFEERYLWLDHAQRDFFFKGWGLSGGSERKGNRLREDSAPGLRGSWVSRDRGLTVTPTPSARTIEHY